MSSSTRLAAARARSGVRGSVLRYASGAVGLEGSCVATHAVDRRVLSWPRRLSTAVGYGAPRRYGFSRVPGADEGNNCLLLYDTCPTRRKSMRHHYPLSSPLPRRSFTASLSILCSRSTHSTSPDKLRSFTPRRNLFHLLTPILSVLPWMVAPLQVVCL